MGKLREQEKVIDPNDRAEYAARNALSLNTVVEEG
jgi:hypothetical protein